MKFPMAHICLLGWFLGFMGFPGAAFSQEPLDTPIPSPTLSPTPILELGEIVITAEKPKGEVIERGDLGTMKSDGRLGDLLNRQGGLEAQGLGGSKSFSNLSVRGNSSNQTLILLNGHKVTQGFDLGSIPTEDIETIEVIKGPAALSLGPEATGGAINVITRPSRQGGSLGIAGGDFGTYQLHASTGSWRSGAWEGSLSGNFNQTNGYAVNTDEVAWEVDHSSGWEWGEDSFSLSAGYSQKNGGAPNGDSLSAQDTGQYDADDRERKKAFTISLGDDRPLGGWRINPSFSFGWTDILRLNPLGADVAAGVPLKDQNTYDSFDVQTSAYTQGSGWLPSLAVNGEFRREDVQGTEGLADGSARSNDIASFGLQGTADLFKSLSLQWSCRLDWYATHGQTTFNPSGTLKYELVSGQDLYLSAGTGYRYPGFDELYHPYVAYTVGPDTPVEFGAGETGNPLLNPETSINLEVGTDLKISSLSCKVSGFTDIYSNLIVAAQDVSSFWTFGNVPHSLLSGVEASLAWDFTAWSTLYGNYTYVDSKNTDTQQLIPARLRQKTALGCRLKFVADAELNLYGQYADHNPALYNGPADSPPLVVASSYATANAEFKFDAGRNWKVFLNGTNLLNTIYATLQGLPMPGRYMELGTTITF